MRIKAAVRQMVVSAAMFAIVMLAVVSVDDRVRERVQDLLYGGDGMGSLAARASELAGALATAARYQSIENAPLVVFAAVGATLFVFMFKI